VHGKDLPGHVATLRACERRRCLRKQRRENGRCRSRLAFPPEIHVATLAAARPRRFLCFMTDAHAPSRDIEALLAIMRRLRDPDSGCPWDVEQDFASIAPYTIEEAYEVAGAIEDENWPELKDELGDLLLQVVFHSRMAEERKLFDFGDVVAAITAKMIRRHPHVFASGAAMETSEAQTLAWEDHKKKERAEKATDGGKLLDGVPRALPALLRTLKFQKRLSSVGFDWDSAPKVLEKIVEEAQEVAEAQALGLPQAKIEEEIGDLLFVVVNLARHLKVDPETALRVTNSKVERRFGYVEEQLATRGRTASEASLEEMEALWQAAKPAVG
jgi:ATP diphosphatase